MLMNKSKKNILLMEGDTILGSFLHKYLQKNNYYSILKNRGGDIPSVVNQKRFDIAIIDVNVPGRDGLYWLRWLKTYHPGMPVICTSTDSSKDECMLGLVNGAHHYLIKPFCEAELLTCLEDILSVTASHNSSHLKYSFETY